ncbi:MAG: DEAD/DEAH box helicase [Betaproteobacteria bacterium]
MSLTDIIAAQGGTVEPEDFQARLIEALSAALLRQNPPPCLLRAPTGAGKTFMLTRALENVSQTDPTLWLWFVPYVNLVQQTEDALATHATGLHPVSLARGRNQMPAGGLVLLATAAAVAKARSRKTGYTDGEDDDMRSIASLVTLARGKRLKIGLVVDEAHIGLDSQTEFGQFTHWVKPDRLVMASATPKDERLAEFLQKAGYAGFEAFTVARDEVVLARLNKRYIEAIVYSLRESMQSVADLAQTVLRQGWKRSQRLKARLDRLGIPITPLLLVQVGNGANAVAEARDVLVRQCRVPPSAIGEHSADDPDPVLMASIASDTTKEVLIFKQSAGTGFDAPRAFVLASTKPVNDPDFALQFIGRVMRVHRQMRAAFPRPKPVDSELDTAYIYLANSEAQAGFEQAVAATANLRSQLEGQTEKLVARKTVAGAVHYSNRETDFPPLLWDTPLPSAGAAGPKDSLPVVPLGYTASLFDADTSGDGMDPDLDPPDLATLHSTAATPAGAPAKKPARAPATKEEFLRELAAVGLRSYSKRSGVAAPTAFMAERRPELADMERAARAATARLDFPADVERLAIAVAMNRVREVEIHTELTTGERREEQAMVAVDRAALARAAHEAMRNLPQIEEADARAIIDVLVRRLEPKIREALLESDASEEVDPVALKRKARDAAHWIVHKRADELAALLHEEIAAQAEVVPAGALPDAMVFPSGAALDLSVRNIYGVFPPSKEDIASLPSLLTLDARMLLHERVVVIGAGSLRLAPYDSSHALGQEERVFCRALDRASFVLWWHRNPDRKEYSVRLVRGEHRNYFYPDFVVCLEHYPGDEPLSRLVETKESTKDAARKGKRVSPVYGKVLFLTRDGSQLRVVNDDGSLDGEVDLDDLAALREWLRQTRPASAATHS